MDCRGNSVDTVVPVLRDHSLISGRFMCNYTGFVSDYYFLSFFLSFSSFPFLIFYNILLIQHFR